jgi:hypothetical protein
MNLERGFRRITFAVSLTGLCAGLGLTAHDTYATWGWKIPSPSGRLACESYFRSLPNEPTGGKHDVTVQELDCLDYEVTSRIQEHLAFSWV